MSFFAGFARAHAPMKKPAAEAAGPQKGSRAGAQALPSTLAGSTFTPGPMVEVMATRWM